MTGWVGNVRLACAVDGWQEVLSFLSPPDLLAFGQTCHSSTKFCFTMSSYFKTLAISRYGDEKMRV